MNCTCCETEELVELSGTLKNLGNPVSVCPVCDDADKKVTDIKEPKNIIQISRMNS